jgi:MFS family permease
MLSYAMLYGMFFLISFSLVRGYHDSAELAGARLALIPVALGIVAPFSGALGERLGPRRLGLAEMAICIAALIILSFVAAEPIASRPIGMAALALFGTGLGLFIAPNNNATMSAAPALLSGEAGAMVNLMRVFGSSLGIASAASMLSWHFGVLTGPDGPFAGRPLLGAVERSFALIAVFAMIAAMAALVRNKSAP